MTALIDADASKPFGGKHFATGAKSVTRGVFSPLTVNSGCYFDCCRRVRDWPLVEAAAEVSEDRTECAERKSLRHLPELAFMGSGQSSDRPAQCVATAGRQQLV